MRAVEGATGWLDDQVCGSSPEGETAPIPKGDLKTTGALSRLRYRLVIGARSATSLRSARSLANLMTTIKRTGYFKNVDFKITSQDSSSKEMTAFTFTLTCEKQPAKS